MNINASLWIQWIPFLILAIVTAKFIWPPIVKALDERALKIADGLAAADKAKAELSNANKAVEAQLAQTRTETTKLLGDAEKRAAAIVDEAKRKAVDEAAKIVADAKADADLQVSRARDQLRDEVAALAVKGAEAILRKEVNAAAHADLLARLKTEL